jgi:hypothetical protein
MLEMIEVDAHTLASRKLESGHQVAVAGNYHDRLRSCRSPRSGCALMLSHRSTMS